MPSNVRNINGLVALVTGGASGLGEGTVRRLVRNGAQVVICDLPASKGVQLAEELGEERCAFAAADVTNTSEVERVLKFVETRFQKLDVVVNCAGVAILCPTYDFETDTPHPLEEFERVLSINTTGTFNVIRLSVGLMGRNTPGPDGQRGVIVNVSSIAAVDCHSGQVAYAASKGAVDSMTLPLARELGPRGIRCCTIEPGIFETPILGKVDEAILRHLAAQVPFPQRLGDCDEFAHLVQSIIENPMLNGCVIRIDGALRLSAQTTPVKTPKA